MTVPSFVAWRLVCLRFLVLFLFLFFLPLNKQQVHRPKACIPSLTKIKGQSGEDFQIPRRIGLHPFHSQEYLWGNSYQKKKPWCFNSGLLEAWHFPLVLYLSFKIALSFPSPNHHPRSDGTASNHQPRWTAFLPCGPYTFRRTIQEEEDRSHFRAVFFPPV